MAMRHCAKMAEEEGKEGGRATGGKAVGEGDRCVLVAGTRWLAAGQRRKTKRDATINLRTEAVRLLRIRARDRPPCRRRQATAEAAVVRPLRAGCGSEAVSGRLQRTKTKQRDATINSRT